LYITYSVLYLYWERVVQQAQRVSNIALPQAQHKATSPTRKTLAVILTITTDNKQ